MIDTCSACQTPLPPEEWDVECNECGSQTSDKKIDHLIESTIAGGHLVCLHCGEITKTRGGAFSAVLFAIYAFRCDHTDCEPCPEGDKLKELMASEDQTEFKNKLRFRGEY
jgi:hypothetical protein